MDFMIKTQIDPKTGEEYPPFGVYNDPDNYYGKLISGRFERDAIYIIKANPQINTEAHVNLQSHLGSGKLKFLVSERQARERLASLQKGKAMSLEERNEYLIPYVLTDILKEEMANLRQKNEGTNILLERQNNKIQKDKVSSLEYNLYYIKVEEDGKKKKKRFDASQWRFFT